MVTLKGNQFIKNEITEVDDSDKEVKNYLLVHEDFIEIIDESKPETISEPTVKEPIAEEPIAEESIAEESKVEETKVEETEVEEIKEKKVEESEEDDSKLINEGCVENTIVDEVKKE